MQKADALIRSMKQRIDALVASDEKLQQFLMWVNQKSLSVNVTYKPAAVRAFYFILDRALHSALERVLDPTLDLTLEFDLDLALDRALDRTLNRALERAFDPALERALDPAFVPALVPTLNGALVRALDLALVRALDSELRQALKQLKKQLPNRDCNQERLKKWWQANGQAWTEALRYVMIKHRNIGHDWQFSKEQREVVKQYYRANKLLMDCLNSDCNVTPAVREEIEETLLLPIALIEKRRSCHR